MYFKRSKKIERITKDMAINLIGTGVSMAILQLIINPLLAKYIDADVYGEMQSVISVIYLIGGTLGGALSTTRLLRDYEYSQKEVSGDFNFLIIVNLLCICVASPIILIFYLKEPDAVSIVLITVIMLLNCTDNYYCVGFRLNLDYKAIFIQKLVSCVGYLVGFAVFYFFIRRWEVIYIASFLFDTLYCIGKTTLIREPYQRSALLKQTVKDFGSLTIARFTSSALTYFDKLILYPLMGGEAVSVYFAANIFGKLILMAIEPITNVILSYLAKLETITKKMWKRIVPVAVAVCSVMYLACLLISRPVLHILYPQWAEAALQLVPVAALAFAAAAFTNILYPFTLKSLPSYYQIIINVAGLGSYIIAVLSLYHSQGLRGCCISLLISYMVKLFSIIVISVWRYLKNEKNA